MHQRIDGACLARLHLEDGVHAPMIICRFTSLEEGRRGCELWSLSHEQALRRELALKLRRPVAGECSEARKNKMARGRSLSF